MNWGRGRWNVLSGVFTSFSNLHHVHGHQAERCPSWRSVMPTWRHEGLHYLPHPSLRACVQRSQWQNADAARGLDCSPLSRLSWGGAAHFFFRLTSQHLQAAQISPGCLLSHTFVDSYSLQRQPTVSDCRNSFSSQWVFRNADAELLDTW